MTAGASIRPACSRTAPSTSESDPPLLRDATAAEKRAVFQNSGASTTAVTAASPADSLDRLLPLALSSGAGCNGDSDAFGEVTGAAAEVASADSATSARGRRAKEGPTARRVALASTARHFPPPLEAAATGLAPAATLTRGGSVARLTNISVAGRPAGDAGGDEPKSPSLPSPWIAGSLAEATGVGVPSRASDCGERGVIAGDAASPAEPTSTRAVATSAATKPNSVAAADGRVARSVCTAGLGMGPSMPEELVSTERHLPPGAEAAGDTAPKEPGGGRYRRDGMRAVR